MGQKAKSERERVSLLEFTQTFNSEEKAMRLFPGRVLYSAEARQSGFSSMSTVESITHEISKYLVSLVLPCIVLSGVIKEEKNGNRHKSI